MQYFVLILAVVALSSAAALPTPRSSEEFTGFREDVTGIAFNSAVGLRDEDVTAADFEEPVDRISKQYGQFVPGLGYVSYYSPLWNHIKDMSAEELNTFIEGLYALHQAENEEQQVASRRKDNAYGEYVEGLGFVNYHNPLWSIIQHFDSDELKAFVSELHQHHHRPIPYAQEPQEEEEEAEESPNDDQNAEDVADVQSSLEEKAIEAVLDVEEEASNGEEGKAQNEQTDEENQEEAQDDSDGAQEEGRDGEDEQTNEENENQEEAAGENYQGEGRDGEDENDDDNSGEKQEDDDAKPDEDGDVAARQNENDEDNDASEAEGDKDDADVEKRAKQ